MQRLVWVFILILQSYLVSGQSSEFSFEHLGTEEGLSNLGVTCIVQDYKGYMWFGTFNGLNRFDGYEMTTYITDPKDLRSISETRITCIYEDKQKNLWIGTNIGGLNKYDREKNNFIRYTKEARPPYKISANKIETIYQDSNDNLWVGTNDGLNLFDYKTHSFKSFYKSKIDSSINSNQIYSIIDNEQGELLILTNETQLNKYKTKPGHFTHFDLSKNQDGLLNTARFLYTDNRHKLWIGTLDDGLLKYNGGTLKQYQSNPKNKRSLSHSLIKTILHDNTGTLWIGTDGGGLNIYNPDTDDFTQIKADEENKNSLSSNAVYSLYQDRAGTIWIGTFGGGINIYHRSKAKFANYTSKPSHINSLANKSVLSLLEDKGSVVWIGTDGGGLTRFNRKENSFKHYRHNANAKGSLSSDVVKSLYEDKKGNLWVGTYLGGLNLYNRLTNTFERINPDVEPPETSSLSNIWFIYEDSKNNLWLSTLGNGLCIYNHDKNNVIHFKPLSGDGSLGDYNVISMMEDTDGNLWIGTEDHGLNIYNYKTQKFTSIRHDPTNDSSLSNDHAWVLFEDSNKNVWIGTAGGGLNLFNKKNGTFEHLTVEDGLPSNIVSGILEDHQGNLWITTGKGLTKFNPHKKTFKNYDAKDGLQSNDFNINATMASKSGELYIGGANGFNVFNPSHLQDNSYIPPIVITDFKIFNKHVEVGGFGSILQKQISETDKITISYKASVISFKFAALNYISCEKNQYAYIMEGFEDNWNYRNTTREVTYTNLDPGTYIFKIKAANNDGLWNEAGTSIQIIITPPWWKTTWFTLFFVLLVITIIVGVYKIRTRNIRQAMRLEKLHELQTKEAQIREERLEHEKAVIELSKSKLESEVQFKNAELATSVMNVVKQNETLLQIKEEVAQAVKEENKEALARQIKRIVKHIDLELKPDQSWNQFEQLFNQIHENFLQKLKERFPELTSRDLKLCAYLRMNLNSKEIAPLLSLSVRGVEDLRYRVRKKMGLDTSVNLAEFVLSL